MTREDIEAFIRAAIDEYDDHMGKEDPMPAVVAKIADKWTESVAEEREEAYKFGQFMESFYGGYQG